MMEVKLTTGQDPYEDLDWDRRRRPEWVRRGVVFSLLRRSGSVVDYERFTDFVHSAGYSGTASVSGFFRGDPQPVMKRDGDEVSLTLRGDWAAQFFDQYWLPQLRSGAVAWPTRQAQKLLEQIDQA